MGRACLPDGPDTNLDTGGNSGNPTMKSIVTAAAICGALVVTTPMLAPAALAEVGISFNIGDVSLAYRDGYWDSHHQWHAWRNDNDWKAFRNAHPDHYRDYAHDRDEHHDH
jgi:hypothetical protein